MGPSKFVDEINRLFDELVRDPWGAARRELPAPGRGGETEFEVTVPVEEHVTEDVSVSLEGRELVVSVRRDRAQRAVIGETEVAAGVGEHFRRAIVVPAGASLRAVETRLESGALRIRIRLATP
jgi:HSP20 family molecular chaperone IbpA